MRYFVMFLIILLTTPAVASKKAKRTPNPSAKIYSLVSTSIGCDVTNVVASGPDKTKWVVTYDASCIDAQRAAGSKIVQSFDYDAWLAQQ